jgi:hypothetical protein
METSYKKHDTIEVSTDMVPTLCLTWISGTKEGQVCVREADRNDERKLADQGGRQLGWFQGRKSSTFACKMVLISMHTYEIGSEVRVIADQHRQPWSVGSND